MADLKNNISDFIDISIDELASAEVPFFKEVKAIFRVVDAGKRIIASSNNTAFDEYLELIKLELKKLSNASSTDSDHFKQLLVRFKVLLQEQGKPLNLYTNIEQLEAELFEGTTIPRESELPKQFAILIRENIAKLVSPEEWGRANYDKLDQIAQKESLQEFLEHAVLPASRSHYENRLLYLNDRLPLCGRKLEIQQLETFLLSSDRVSVWAICGQGGVGKSKLARHICQKHEKRFKFVWLKDADFPNLARITSGYQYDGTVVFICDYADEREQNIVTLIDKVYDSKTLKARFLLLSRVEDWYLKFARKNDVIREIGYTLSSKYLPLDLSKRSLNDEEYKEILTKYQTEFYPEHPSLTDDDITYILEQTERTVPSNSVSVRANRCLFVLLVADSFLQGCLPKQNDAEQPVGDAGQLLKNYFDRSCAHLPYSDDLKTSGFRLFALATALRGIDLDDDTLPQFIRKDIEHIEEGRNYSAQSINDFWSKLSENFYDAPILHPYEPDLIGEFLFLWKFHDLTKQVRQKWCEYLIERAEADTNENPIEIFINRCVADWSVTGGTFFTYYSQVMQKMNESENSHV